MKTFKIEVCNLLDLYWEMDCNKTKMAEYMEMDRKRLTEWIKSAKSGYEILLQIHRKPSGEIAYHEIMRGLSVPNVDCDIEDVHPHNKLVQDMLKGGFTIDAVAEFLADGQHTGRAFKKWQKYLIKAIESGRLVA